MSVIRKFAAWFTPERRQKIQVFLASLVPILIGLGYATQVQAEQSLILAAAGLQFIASLLNLVNLSGGLTIWTALRGAIYTLAAAAAPALTVLGYIDEQTSTLLLTGVSLALSTASSLIAVFVSKDQVAARSVADVELEGGV